ncbi:MAG: hypothetical protein ACK4VK_04730 [Aquificaceae bacterium]
MKPLKQPLTSTCLITDLYELTMAQAYFSLFVRKLPEKRNFLVACGLEPLIEALENFLIKG